MKTPYWAELIDDCLKGKKKIENEHMVLSFDWVTCACGKQDPLLHSGPERFPWDNALSSLGATFPVLIANAYGWCDNGDDERYFSYLKEAKDILSKIEYRATLVLEALHEGLSKGQISSTWQEDEEMTSEQKIKKANNLLRRMITKRRRETS